MTGGLIKDFDTDSSEHTQSGYNKAVHVVVDETEGGDHCGRQIAIAEHLKAFPMCPVPYTVRRRRIEKFM